MLLNFLPGPVCEVDQGGHDLRWDVLDLDDVVVVVPLEELGLNAEHHPVHVELAVAAGAALDDLRGDFVEGDMSLYGSYTGCN